MDEIFPEYGEDVIPNSQQTKILVTKKPSNPSLAPVEVSEVDMDVNAAVGHVDERLPEICGTLERGWKFGGDSGKNKYRNIKWKYIHYLVAV